MFSPDFFENLHPLKEDTENVEIFRGLWPGAKVVFYVEGYEMGQKQPVNSWVLTDENGLKWFVWVAMIKHPDKEVIITYKYDPEAQFPEIALLRVQLATQREYAGLFKVIHALRQVYFTAPGPSPDINYDLAAGMIGNGIKPFNEVLGMFHEDNKEAARQALRRRGITGSARNR